MTKFVKATYHTETKAAEYIADDGRHLIRTGGSLQWRLFNCGNLASPMIDGVPAPRKTKNYIGFANAGTAGLHFFIFPDYETGRNEVKASLLRKYKDKTLSETMYLYAPPRENDTERYIRQLGEVSGVERTEVIGELTAERLNKLIEGIQRLEGYDAKIDTRKEVWVTVSHVQATDGTRPVANAEIVVKDGAKTTTLKSNAAGRFPPIVHGKKPVEVHHVAADGQLKKVGELPPEKGAYLNLVTKVAEFFGTTAPVKPPPKPVKGKQPLEYVVQPGDILGRLAKDFGVTVAEIQKDNQLKTTNIMAGQRLGIYGPPSSGLPRAAPKQAAKLPAPLKPAKPQSSTAPAKPAKAEPPKAAAPRPKPRKAPTPDAETAPARSKKGEGEALALLPVEEGIAPWMKHAIAEAKKWKGAEEDVIQKGRNFQTIIKTGRTSMMGSDNAWCAAFVNWHLMQAGYPIENPKETGFIYRTAAKGRANGFISVKGQKADKKQKYEDVPWVDNPLFYTIKEPVYGAIAVQAHPGGAGHHTGFVYAKERDNILCILGGNQSDRIKFSPFNILPVKAVAAGKKQRKVKGAPDHLVFLLPASYKNPAENGPDKLTTADCEALNIAIGIPAPKKPAKATAKPEPERTR